MDEQTKELIAIGASVTANCEPCLEFHLRKAREYGASEKEISDAIGVGKTVKKGAMSKYNEFINTLLGEVKTHHENSSGCGCN